MTFSKFLIFIAIEILILASSCHHASEPHSSTGPNARSFTWIIDTVAYPGGFQTIMESIYGTSSKNVYMVGWNELNRGMMYRFDGVKWQSVRITRQEDGPISGGLGLLAIHGTAPNDIWVVGSETFLNPVNGQVSDSSLIIHFDGSTWSKAVIPRSSALWAVWCAGPGEVLAGSGSGEIIRLHGGSWIKYSLGPQYFVSSVCATSINEAYAVGHVSDAVVPVDSSGSFLFRFDGSRWTKIDSVMSTPGAASAQMGIAVYAFQGVLYSTSPNVYRRSGSSWMKLLDAQVGSLNAHSSSNIVAVGQTVYHFNGFDWKELPQLRANGLPWFDCYVAEDAVFIVGNDNVRTYVARRNEI